MPASSLMRIILNRSLRLFLHAPLIPLTSPFFSSSSLLSIISGLLVRVATELAVFLLGDVVGGGVATTSLETELRDSQEKGLVSFREGATIVGAVGVAVVVVGAGAGAVTVIGAAAVTMGDEGFLVGESFTGGDQGIDGRAFVMLLSDIVLDPLSSSGISTTS